MVECKGSAILPKPGAAVDAPWYHPPMRMLSLIYLITAIAALAAASQITFSLPGTPVPQTGQTLAVLLIGALAGPVRGPAAIAGYLALGAAGLPVFADGGSGVEALTGATGGFLVGFVAAAALAGWASRQLDQRLPAVWWYRLPALASALVGCHAVILLCGWIRLAGLIRPGEAFAAGIMPFVAGALAKSLLAAAVTWLVLRLRHGRAHGVASDGSQPG